MSGALALPDKSTEGGLESRVLLAECRSPAFGSYKLEDAKNCMKLMDLVLWNRVADPKPFLAHAGTLKAVVTAKGQFAGFESYPNYDANIRQRIQDMINIANNSKDKRSSAFADHIQAAIDIAETATIPDPTSGKLVAWRTTGASSPGSGFTFFRTVFGNDFYFK